MRALLSVYDKTDLTDFARALHDSGYSNSSAPVALKPPSPMPAFLCSTSRT